MRPPRLLGAAVCAAVILSGCSASTPEPTVGPTPSMTPSAQAARTTTGLYGDVLHVVSRDASFTPPRCRELGEVERDGVERVGAMTGGESAGRDSPAVAVNVTSRWVVVAFLYPDGGAGAFLTDNTNAPQAIPASTVIWAGSHTLAGISLEGGPDALDAALQCLD